MIIKKGPLVKGGCHFLQKNDWGIPLKESLHRAYGNGLPPFNK